MSFLLINELLEGKISFPKLFSLFRLLAKHRFIILLNCRKSYFYSFKRELKNLHSLRIFLKSEGFMFLFLSIKSEI